MGLTAGLGLIGGTFETAITWDRWPALDAAVRQATSKPTMSTAWVPSRPALAAASAGSSSRRLAGHSLAWAICRAAW
jgi:hypothetical protein